MSNVGLLVEKFLGDQSCGREHVDLLLLQECELFGQEDGGIEHLTRHVFLAPHSCNGVGTVVSKKLHSCMVPGFLRTERAWQFSGFELET